MAVLSASVSPSRAPGPDPCAPPVPPRPACQVSSLSDAASTSLSLTSLPRSGIHTASAFQTCPALIGSQHLSLGSRQHPLMGLPSTLGALRVSSPPGSQSNEPNPARIPPLPAERQLSQGTVTASPLPPVHQQATWAPGCSLCRERFSIPGSHPLLYLNAAFSARPLLITGNPRQHACTHTHALPPAPFPLLSGAHHLTSQVCRLPLTAVSGDRACV